MVRQRRPSFLSVHKLTYCDSRIDALDSDAVEVEESQYGSIAGSCAISSSSDSTPNVSPSIVSSSTFRDLAISSVAHLPALSSALLPSLMPVPGQLDYLVGEQHMQLDPDPTLQSLSLHHLQQQQLELGQQSSTYDRSATPTVAGLGHGSLGSESQAALHERYSTQSDPASFVRALSPSMLSYAPSAKLVAQALEEAHYRTSLPVALKASHSQQSQGDAMDDAMSILTTSVDDVDVRLRDFALQSQSQSRADLYIGDPADLFPTVNR